MSEYEIEPIPGLPEPLPPGETILWQGVPQWESLARRAFHIRAATLYFAGLLVWSFTPSLAGREALSKAAGHAMFLSLLAACLVALLAVLAWLVHKTTIYTVTTQRVIMRCGIALPIVLNLPFKLIHSAGVKVHPDGTGDIVLQLAPSERLAYVMLWPHVRPWRFKHSEPMLRGIGDAASAAQILSRALAAASGLPAQPFQAESPQDALGARPPAAAAA